jgi:hypothetical protein
LRERLDIEDVKLLEELFILEGIFFDPYLVEELEFKAISAISINIPFLNRSL